MSGTACSDGQREADAASNDLITASGVGVFGQDDALRLLPQFNIDAALASIEPLPEALRPTSSELTLPYLEALLVRGRALRSALAGAARQEGNDLFAKSRSLTGSAKHAAWKAATELYTMAIQDEN